jgi:hypothetical protein
MIHPSQNTSVELFLGFLCDMVFIHQNNEISNYEQGGCGAKLKTEKEVEVDLKLSHTVLWYKFWRKRAYYCFNIKNNNCVGVIMLVSQTAIELSKKIVTKKGTLGVKVGGHDVANLFAGVQVKETKVYEKVSRISAYMIPASQEMKALVPNKIFHITFLVSKGGGYYFCSQRNVFHNSKYWNYEIPNMTDDGSQPVVTYDGVNIVPQSPNEVYESIDTVPTEMTPELNDGSETSPQSPNQKIGKNECKTLKKRVRTYDGINIVYILS